MVRFNPAEHSPLRRSSQSSQSSETSGTQRPASGPVSRTGSGNPLLAVGSQQNPPRAKGMGPRLPIDELVLKDGRFPDGSVRPDRLTSLRVTEGPANGTDGGAMKPVLRDSSGRPILGGNHFGIPQYRMDGIAEPYTDAHFHPTNYVQRGLTMARMLEMMDQVGVRNSVAMPIPTSLLSIPQPGGDARVAINPHALAAALDGESSASGEAHGHHHCAPLESYYVPQSIVDELTAKLGKSELTTADWLGAFKAQPGLIDRIVAQSELYLDTAVNDTLANEIRGANLNQAQRSRIDPMITGLHLGDPRVGDKLLRAIATNPGIFTGIGEITVHKELVENMFAGQRGQADTHKDMEPLKRLLETAGVVGMPVTLHCDIDNLQAQIQDRIAADKGKGKPREPANFEGLKQLFNDPRVKDTQIVWAHAGGLGRFVQESDGHLDKLRSLLEDCPNLKLDISWSEVAKQLTKSPEKMAEWKDFLEEHNTRILFGSDSLAPVNTGKWSETKEKYADLFDQLSPHARENILNHNYENTFVASRAKVREFESQVLTPEFVDENLKNILGPDGKPAQPVGVATLKAAKAAGAQAAEHARADAARATAAREQAELDAATATHGESVVDG